MIVGALEWFEPGEYDRVERVVERMRPLGMAHIRTGISWAETQRPENDAWYAWLRPRLARDLGVIPCYVYTPPSLGVEESIAPPPVDPKAFADFLDAQIDQHGEHFDWVELWNEPNNAENWDYTLHPDWEAFGHAYDPDKPWYRDPAIAGGGCMLELDCHLMDAMQWLLPDETFHVRSARPYAGGRPVGAGKLEDHAIVEMEGDGTTAQVHWNVPSGGDAEVRIHLYGTHGGLRFSNVGGSFYDFRAEHLAGTQSRPLCEPPDRWGGRQLLRWTQSVHDRDTTFRAEAWQVAENARLLEETYQCAS